MSQYQRGKLTFTWDPANNQISKVFINGNDFAARLRILLNNTDRNQGHYFNMRRRFFFDKETIDMCLVVFDAIKEIKQNDKDDILAAFLATFLYQLFAEFWQNELLANGLYLPGVSFWQSLIAITKDWETKNTKVLIHKGTPFFFLAFNCLVNGDRDNGFTYLYNAIEDDKKLKLTGYPWSAPAYLTATMSDKLNNYMYPQVRELRLLLGNYLQKFKSEFSPTLTMYDFDVKFLSNIELADVVYFFVYNFQYVYDQSHNKNYDLLQNEFSRLRILDLFFNFGLIIDEVLKYAASKAGYASQGMKESIVWWSQRKLGLNQIQLDRMISSRGLNLKKLSPDKILPVLLSNTQKPNKIIKKEVYTMLIAYRLRNHAGHNLDQQNILTLRYDEILDSMFYSLFLALQSF